MKQTFLLPFLVTAILGMPLIAPAQTTARSSRHSVAVVIIEIPGVESGLSSAAVENLFWGTSGVAETYQQISSNQISLKRWSSRKPFVYGPVTVMPKSGELCDNAYRQWSDRALDMLGSDRAALEQVDHVVFLFPPADLLGCSVRARGELFGNYSWIFVPVVNTIVHEIGHNLGLGHAALGDSRNITSEYGDRSSPMGFPVSGTMLFNAPELAQLRWISPASTTKISTYGTYEQRLGALETYTSGDSADPIMLRVDTPAPRRRYIISYRQLQSPALPGLRIFQQGVSVHLERGLGNMTVLAATLRDGESFFDPASALKIIQISHGAGAASVRVILPGNERPLALDPPGVPEGDRDNDGVLDAQDCAADDPLSWSTLAAIDADDDGIPDSRESARICFGDNAPTGYAAFEEQIDNCPGVVSALTRDSNRDGIGDACTSDLTQSKRLYKKAALLRQLRHTILLAQREKYDSGAASIIAVARRLAVLVQPSLPSSSDMRRCIEQLDAAAVQSQRIRALTQALQATNAILVDNNIALELDADPINGRARSVSVTVAPCEVVKR